jgi:hypothetical protein
MSFLFSGGTGRSGTTVVLEMLGTHSEVYVSNPIEIKKLVEKTGWLDQYSNKMLTKEEVYSLYFKEFLKQNIKKDTAKYWGDSTPENIRCAHKINEVFPNSKFIHMVRDGRDAGYSEYLVMMGSGHAKTPIDGLEFWKKRLIQSFESLKKVDSKLYINVRLEELVINNREFEKNKILSFLNLKEEELLTSFFNTQVNMSKMSVGKWKSLDDWKKIDFKYSEALKELEFYNIYIEKYY